MKCATAVTSTQCKLVDSCLVTQTWQHSTKSTHCRRGNQ